MTTCPDLASERLTDDDNAGLASHIEKCVRCRAQLDAESDFSPWLTTAPSGVPHSTEMLTRAIDALQSNAMTIQDHAPLPTGSRLGTIEIRKMIGRGGMGIVYEGFDTKLERAVAVKLLAPHMAIRLDGAERLLREARSAAAVIHENILAIHAIEESPFGMYLVLPLIDGESLSDWLKREPQLPFATVRSVAIQVARGLTAAHECGLIHRDIKPGNLLIERKSGQVKIADFGLAVHAQSATTDRELASGTVSYMSPEQFGFSARGRAADRHEQMAGQIIDARADLFSLGVVLYQSVSGRHPFEDESVEKTIDRICHKEPPPLTGVPAWFNDAIMSLMAKRPDQRPASAREFLERLESREKQPPRRWMIIGGLLLLTATIGLAFAWPNRPRPTQPPKIGFQIEGQLNFEETLSSAIMNAKSGDTIIVHGDGPFSSPTITIDGKSLTIRAESGSIPKFVPESDLTGISFLDTNADLTLNGLDIRWPVTATRTRADDPGLRSVIVSRGGRLTCTRCRVIAGTFAFAIGSSSPEGVALSQCHIISATDGGVGIAWKASPKSELSVSECVIRAKIGMFLGPAGGRLDPAGTLLLSRNTIIADRAIQFGGNPRNRARTTITAQENIFDSSILVALFQANGFGPSIVPTIHSTGHAFFGWADHANVYRSDIVWIGGNRPNNITSFLPGELTTLDSWQTYIGQSKKTSTESTIKYRMSVDSTEVVPEPIESYAAGAPLDAVGPRRTK